MANSTISTKNTEAVVVNAAPPAAGYWSKEVLNKKIYFTARGSGTAVPTLQFRDSQEDSVWTDFYNAGTAFAIGDVYEISVDAPTISWRVGVKQANYSSGEVTIGLNW